MEKEFLNLASKGCFIGKLGYRDDDIIYCLGEEDLNRHNSSMVSESFERMRLCAGFSYNSGWTTNCTIVKTDIICGLVPGGLRTFSEWYMQCVYGKVVVFYMISLVIGVGLLHLIYCKIVSISMFWVVLLMLMDDKFRKSKKSKFYERMRDRTDDFVIKGLRDHLFLFLLIIIFYSFELL